jgi:REP element-mobilizing transposase RayT
MSIRDRLCLENYNLQMPPKFIRKKIRLGIEEIYKSKNSFFVTICVEERKCIFVDTIKSGNYESDNYIKSGDPRHPLQLNRLGQIVEQAWLNLTEIFENIELDEFVVMPNHFHGIITFLGVPKSKFTNKESDLGKIIKRFKLESLRKIVQTVTDGHQNIENQNTGRSVIASTHLDLHGRSVIASTGYLVQKHKTIWQKSFYDHIVRSENDLQRIQQYILNNPLKWKLDILNAKNEDKYQKWRLRTLG